MDLTYNHQQDRRDHERDMAHNDEEIARLDAELNVCLDDEQIEKLTARILELEKDNDWLYGQIRWINSMESE